MSCFKVEITKESGDICEAMNKAILSCAPIQENVQANKMALPRIEFVTQGTLMRLTRAREAYRR